MSVSNSEKLGMTLHRLTLRSLASGLSSSPNRCVSDFAIASSKFLALLGTSDIPGTVGDIA